MKWNVELRLLIKLHLRLMIMHVSLDDNHLILGQHRGLALAMLLSTTPPNNKVRRLQRPPTVIIKALVIHKYHIVFTSQAGHKSGQYRRVASHICKYDGLL